MAWATFAWQQRRQVGLLAALGIVVVCSIGATDASPLAGAGPGWVERNLTIPNLLLIAGFMLHIGQLRQEWKQFGDRLKAIEEWREKLEEPGSRFVRTDVLAPTLDAMRSDIDLLLKHFQVRS